MDGNQSDLSASARYRESNRALWDEWTSINAKSSMYDLEGFKRGRNTLKPFEIEEVGDVSGKSLLHLQCHFGLDTLSWARLGASVTGADFSPKAIELARSLAADLGIPSSFVCSDLYDLPGALDGRFDFVYTSFGVITWLPDLGGWAKVIDHFLEPGGFFYIAEFHPFVWVMDDSEPVTELRVKWPYFPQAEPLGLPVEGSYADRTADMKTKVEYDWPHSIGEVVTALSTVGLVIEFLHEFPYTIFRQLPFLQKSDEGRYYLPESQEGEIPLMFSLRARKPRPADR